MTNTNTNTNTVGAAAGYSASSSVVAAAARASPLQSLRQPQFIASTPSSASIGSRNYLDPKGGF